MNLFSFFGRGSTQLPQASVNDEKMLASLLVMAWVVEARDPYTGGHLWRVSRFSRMLAERSGLRSEDVARISIGGFLHDLGKVGIPDAILNKKEKLTDEE
jgi:HD-GYP domain-containing protein (c-di-GMP phosphodiesterase class II)